MPQTSASASPANTLPIVFAHANSFPLDTYRLLFSLLRQRGIAASGVQRFGHDPARPVTNHWPHLVDELIEYVEQQVQQHGQPLYLVGHSLGGILSFQAATKRPDLARGVLLIDSPLLGGWKANAVGLAKQTQIVGSVSPGKISQRRRNTWASNAEALEYFRSKKAFAHWHPQVLQDYVEHGLVDHQDKRTLLFQREVETAIYNTLPSNLNNQLRLSPLRCPVALYRRTFLGGDAPGGHGDDAAHHQGAHHDAGWQPPVSHGAARSHGGGHRGLAAQYGAEHLADGFGERSQINSFHRLTSEGFSQEIQ